jgi:hypothetical protein
MKESVTYQAILREGWAEGFAKGFAKGFAQGQVDEARRVLLLIGRQRFGEPPLEVAAALESLTDLQKLEELVLRSQWAAGWHELPGTNG